MRKSLLLIFCLSALWISAQRPAAITDVEVGIVEHLGDTIPLDLRFVNEKGDTVALRQLIDKPTVLSFVYFDCPGLCSPLLDGVSDVIEKSDLELGKDYKVITISFNYRDTPEKAREKKKNFLRRHSKSRSDNWTYLTTDSATIFRITDAAGFKVKSVGFDFIHPSAIIITSPAGKITRYLYGVTFLPFDFKMAIGEAQKGIAQPSINRVLEFCFSYDPQGRRYTLEVTRVAGIVIIFIFLVTILVLFITRRKQKK